jgi:hypothetical protein
MRSKESSSLAFGRVVMVMMTKTRKVGCVWPIERRVEKEEKLVGGGEDARYSRVGLQRA